MKMNNNTAYLLIIKVGGFAWDVLNSAPELSNIQREAFLQTKAMWESAEICLLIDTFLSFALSSQLFSFQEELTPY